MLGCWGVTVDVNVNLFLLLNLVSLVFFLLLRCILSASTAPHLDGSINNVKMDDMSG